MLFKNPNLLQEALEYRVQHQGICWLLKVLRRAKLITSEEALNSKGFMCQYLKDINKYSGNKTYPIQTKNGNCLAKFLTYQSNGTLWDKSHEYGRTRCELFEAIINNINANREEPSDES